MTRSTTSLVINFDLEIKKTFQLRRKNQSKSRESREPQVVNEVRDSVAEKMEEEQLERILKELAEQDISYSIYAIIYLMRRQGLTSN